MRTTTLRFLGWITPFVFIGATVGALTGYGIVGTAEAAFRGASLCAGISTFLGAVMAPLRPPE